MKKFLGLFFVLFLSLIGLTSCSNEKTNIVSTCFAGYDFSKAVAKDLKTSSMLLAPGEELHDYSPSVADIERVLASEVFIYIGGESDSVWVEKQILPRIDNEKTKVVSLMDVVLNGGKTYNEEDPESSTIENLEEDEEEEELDEHVWNSLSNAKLIVNKICEVLIEIDSINGESYKENRDNYINSLNELDLNIKDVISKSNKNLLVFADRFPLLYFVKEYNLEYDAAFKGCESAKEANPKTIEGLVNKVLNNNINVIFVIELSESKIANTVKNELHNQGMEVEIMTFYTMHNVSKDDYNKGMTYIDFMKLNLKSLEIALS